MFIGGRFLVGLGFVFHFQKEPGIRGELTDDFCFKFRSNLAQGSAPLLLVELAYPQHRGKLTTMYNTLWFVGSIVAAWTVFGTQRYTSDASWRIPVAVQAAMPVIQLALIFCLPESPRWLCSKDRLDEAFAVLVKVRAAIPRTILFSNPGLTRRLSQYHANGDNSNEYVRAEFQEIRETIKLERMHSRNGWLVFLQKRKLNSYLLIGLLTATDLMIL